MKEKTKKTKVFIIILICIIIALIGVIGFLGYKYLKGNESIGKDWGDTYLEYLQSKISNNEYENVNEGSLEFIQLEKNQKPAMILGYEKDDEKFLEITMLDEEGKTKTKKVQSDNAEELNMSFLYNIANKEYNWYEHEKRKDGSELFIQIEENDIKNSTEPTEDKRHEFTKEEMTEQRVEEGETQTISKFNEEFVKVETNNDKTYINLDKKIDKKLFRDTIKNAIEKYVPQDKIITDELKENIENTVKELENRKETAQPEEQENGILVGKNLLKFGKYEGTSSGKTYTLIVNKDKTFQIELPWISTVKKGTITITHDDVYNETHVVFGDDYWGVVDSEGNILSQTAIDFHYVGENEKESTSDKSEEQVSKEQTNEDNKEKVEQTESNTSKKVEKNTESTKKNSTTTPKPTESNKNTVEENQKLLDETKKQNFNSQFETKYKGKQNGSNIKELLSKIVSSNMTETNKITVEMNGSTTADASQINVLKTKVATVKNYEVSFNYDSNGYINKIIIK